MSYFTSDDIFIAQRKIAHPGLSRALCLQLKILKKMNNIEAIQYNVHNGWHDITAEKPKSRYDCLVYDSQHDTMCWLYYDDISNKWVDARKGDYDIDINTTFALPILDKHKKYLRDEVHLRFKFWKYIKKAPRLTNPIKVLN